MASRTFVALILYGFFGICPQAATRPAFAEDVNCLTVAWLATDVSSGPRRGLLAADDVRPLAILERRCRTFAFVDPDEDAALGETLWGSPLRLTWTNVDRFHYITGLDASYSVPAEDPAAGNGVRGDRFRAWLRSGVQWRYARDAMVSVDARWGLTATGAAEATAPFQAAATVTVVW